MDIEALEKVVEKYCFNSFKWPLNKQGEPVSIPPGQTVPNGYAKHCKIVRKAFLEGVLWQKVNSYGKLEMESFAEFCIEQKQNDPNIDRYQLWEKWTTRHQQLKEKY